MNAAATPHDEPDPERNNHPGSPAPHAPAVTAHIRPRWALPARLIDELTAAGKVRTVPAGADFAREGDPPDQVFVILSGRVRGYVSDDEDRRLVMGELAVGEYCGEMLIDGLDRCITTAAVEPSRLVAVRRAVFMQIMSTDHELLLHVMRKLAMRLATATELVRRLALADVRERVQHFLLEAATALGSPATPVNISQQAIGDRVGATRSMVNRVLKRMTTEGDVANTPEGLVLKRMPAPIALPPLALPSRSVGAADGGEGSEGAAGREGAGPAERAERPGAPSSPTPLPPRHTRDTRLVLPTDLVEEVRARGRVKHYAPGEFVLLEGAPADTFVLLTRGRLNVTLSSTNGRSFTLGDVRPGEYLGEMTVLDRGKRTASACAVEACEVVHLPRPAFMDLVEHRIDFAKHMAVRLSMRVRQLTNLAKQLALLDVQSRTLALLEYLGEQHGDGSRHIAHPPSQQEIGDRVGASRSMINRVMRELADQGVIVQRGGGLVIRAGKRRKQA